MGVFFPTFLNRKTGKIKPKRKKILIGEFRFVEISFLCKRNTFIGFILVLVQLLKSVEYIYIYLYIY